MEKLGALKEGRWRGLKREYVNISSPLHIPSPSPSIFPLQDLQASPYSLDSTRKQLLQLRIPSPLHIRSPSLSIIHCLSLNFQGSPLSLSSINSPHFLSKPFHCLSLQVSQLSSLFQSLILKLMAPSGSTGSS